MSPLNGPALSEGAEALRERVYQGLCIGLRSGRFVPGEKITIRQIADAEGTSPTPVREALYRLVADGTLVAETNRSTRVPVLTGADMRELRDIRVTVEGLAAARAAERSDAALVGTLRTIAARLARARVSGDHEADRRCVYEFQLSVYRAAMMPHLMRIIEGLWLRTGPYMTLLYPQYVERVATARGDWRAELCSALERHDGSAARAAIELDVHEALSHLADIVEASQRLRSAGASAPGV